jgi:hypothetical protein
MIASEYVQVRKNQVEGGIKGPDPSQTHTGEGIWRRGNKTI